MNKKTPDRRIQRTRQALLKALTDLILEKGYESVTIQDIIDRANIGRSTFYFHFQDKEELLLSGFENMRESFEGFYKRVSPDQTGWDFSLTLFQHAEEHRDFVKAMLGKQAGSIVLNHVQKNLIALLKGHFLAIWPPKNPPLPLDVFVQYLASSFLGLLTWWLNNDAPYSSEQMNAFFKKLTGPTVHSFF